MRKLAIIILSMLVLLYLPVTGQEQQKPNSPSVILEDVKNVFNSGKVEEISDYFSGKTFISIEKAKNGYYSKNQVINILKEFFDENKPIAFNYSSQKTTISSPFATGTFRYAHKGVRKRSYVFVSLTYSNEKWYIAQITIN